MKLEASAEQEKGEKHLHFQREGLCCSGWSCCLFALCQGLLCSRLRKHIESESHFPEEFIVWKDKKNRKLTIWVVITSPWRCNAVTSPVVWLRDCGVLPWPWSGAGLDWHWAHQLTALQDNRLCSAVSVKEGIMVFFSVRWEKEYRHKWISAVGWDAHLHSLHSKEWRRGY